MDTFVKEVGLNADPQVVGEHIERNPDNGEPRLRAGWLCLSVVLGQVRRYHWEFDDPTKATGNPGRAASHRCSRPPQSDKK